MTSGSCPMRSATGGSLPALTSSASCGASLNVLGNFAASVTTSGPSSLPIRPLLAIWARAPAATPMVSSPTTRAIMNRDRRSRVRGVRPRSVMTRPPICRLPWPSVRALTAAPLPRPRHPAPPATCMLGDTDPAGAPRQAAVGAVPRCAPLVSRMAMRASRATGARAERAEHTPPCVPCCGVEAAQRSFALAKWLPAGPADQRCWRGDRRSQSMIAEGSRSGRGS